MPNRIRVLIIDDNRLAREGLSALLSVQPDLNVVATAADIVTGLRQLSATRPDVVLIDGGLAASDQNHCVRQMRMSNPTGGVIVLNLPHAPENVVACAKAGANGFMMKDAALEDLVAAVRSVAGGTDVIPPALAGTLLSHIARDTSMTWSSEKAEAVRLTTREREVMELIANGLGNKAIARQLSVAEDTVKSHVRNMLEKLALHSRLEIAAHRHKVSSSRSDSRAISETIDED